jgi:hypothetical protein
MVEQKAWGKDYVKASYPERVPGQVRYFDIKAFCDSKKRAKKSKRY